MQAAHIQGANKFLGKPLHWDEKKFGKCGTLPVRDEDTTLGPAMSSAWTPTPEEVAAIVAGASVYLTIIGRIHPPVCVSVGPTPEKQ